MEAGPSNQHLTQSVSINLDTYYPVLGDNADEPSFNSAASSSSRRLDSAHALLGGQIFGRWVDARGVTLKVDRKGKEREIAAERPEGSRADPSRLAPSGLSNYEHSRFPPMLLLPPPSSARKSSKYGFSKSKQDYPPDFDVPITAEELGIRREARLARRKAKEAGRSEPADRVRTDADDVALRKRKRRRKGELEKQEEWRGRSWGLMGYCFDIMPLPHSHHPAEHRFPPISSLAPTLLSFPAFKIYPFPLPHPSLPSFSTLTSFLSPLSPSPQPDLLLSSVRPGQQRVKWIVPIHGPVWGLPNDDSSFLSDGVLCKDGGEEEMKVIEELRGKRTGSSSRGGRGKSRTPLLSSAVQQSTSDPIIPISKPTSSISKPSASSKLVRADTDPTPHPSSSLGQPRSSVPFPPAQPRRLTWTRTLLQSFRSSLLHLSSRSMLGPISLVLHPSTHPTPYHSHPFSASTFLAEPAEGGSSEEESPVVVAGDHFRIYVDLAYAMRVRYVLGMVDIRLKEEGNERTRLLEGARLALVDEVGRVILLA